MRFRRHTEDFHVTNFHGFVLKGYAHVNFFSYMGRSISADLFLFDESTVICDRIFNP